MDASGRETFAFLYQSEQGTVGVPTWRRGAVRIGAIFLVLTAIWIFVRPYGSRGLDARSFFDPLALAANIFAVGYTLAVILLAISWVNLTAKRFRDRARKPPVGLAGVLPFLVLLDGAVRWLQPQLGDALPRPFVYLGDAAVAVAVGWTVAECLDLIGPRPSDTRS